MTETIRPQLKELSEPTQAEFLRITNAAPIWETVEARAHQYGQRVAKQAYALGVQAGVRQSADIVESFKGRLIGDNERVIENIKDLYTEVAVAVSSIGRTPDFLSEKAGSTPATATNSAARPGEEPT